MSKFLRSCFAATILIAAFNQGARAESAQATIDWATFTYQLFGIGGGAPGSLTWISQNTGVQMSNSNGSLSDGGSDWTSTFSVANGIVVSSASLTSLNSAFSATLPSASNLGQSNRYGTFTLSDQTLVVFSVDASASIDMTAPPGGAAYAWSVLSAEGGDMFGGPDQQRSETAKLVFGNGAGNPETQSGKLYASFSNLSGADLQGNLNTFTQVNSYGGTIVVVVPEPETYMMFIAGLMVMGSIAMRRARTAKTV